jgi:hypothetical protein
MCAPFGGASIGPQDVISNVKNFQITLAENLKMRQLFLTHTKYRQI